MVEYGPALPPPPDALQLLGQYDDSWQQGSETPRRRGSETPRRQPAEEVPAKGRLEEEERQRQQRQQQQQQQEAKERSLEELALEEEEGGAAPNEPATAEGAAAAGARPAADATTADAPAAMADQAQPAAAATAASAELAAVAGEAGPAAAAGEEEPPPPRGLPAETWSIMRKLTKFIEVGPGCCWAGGRGWEAAALPGSCSGDGARQCRCRRQRQRRRQPPNAPLTTLAVTCKLRRPQRAPKASRACPPTAPGLGSGLHAATACRHGRLTPLLPASHCSSAVAHAARQFWTCSAVDCP